MASTCINNVGMSPKDLVDRMIPYPAPDWLGFNRNFDSEGRRNEERNPNLEGSVNDFVDFEFRLKDSEEMLYADELFSDGKLVPLQLPSMQPAEDCLADIRSPVPINLWRRADQTGPEFYSFSPKAPRCSSRWKELLGLKKAQNSKSDRDTSAPVTSKFCSTKPLKLFLRRNLRSSLGDSSPTIPLLQELDADSELISSFVSLSSSSSSADQEELPRFSVNSENVNAVSNTHGQNAPHVRVSSARSPVISRFPALQAEGTGMEAVRSTIKREPESASTGHVSLRSGRSPVRCPRYSGDLPPPRGSSVDSPRLNASGKVIFNTGLERSSSTSNSGPRARTRGMERSYSANIQVTPVLNVPACILRGSAKSISAFYFGQLFSPQKKEKDGSSAAKHGITGIASSTKTTCERPGSRN